MSKEHLSLAAIVVVVAAIAAAAVITIELGLAFQSQSDSEDVIRVGDYVSAHDIEGNMVAITPVEYVQSQDKESYVLTNVSQSVRGTMDLGTKDDKARSLTTIIDFQERGTWLFIETMDLSMQKEICFVVLVDNDTSLVGTTVLTIDGETVSKCTDSTVSGCWRAWGTGDVVNGYVVANHTADIYNGFIILVKNDTTLSNHYNVITMKGNNGSAVLNLYTPRHIGDTVVSSGSWKAWDNGEMYNEYKLKEGDLCTKTTQSVKVNIYDSMSSTGVAGMQTDPVPVCTGFYNFSIDIRYKSQVKIDPTPYQGERMRSNISFILKEYVLDSAFADKDGSIVMYQVPNALEKYTVILVPDSGAPTVHAGQSIEDEITLSGTWYDINGTARSNVTYKVSSTEADSSRFIVMYQTKNDSDEYTVIKVPITGSASAEREKTEGDDMVSGDGWWYVGGKLVYYP